MRAGLVGSADCYPWSSAAAHLNGVDPTGVVDMRAWNESGRRSDWSEFLSRGEAAACTSLLRSATVLGTPLESRSWWRGWNRPAVDACGRGPLDQRREGKSGTGDDL